MIKYKDVFKNALKDKYNLQFDKSNTDDIIIINNDIKCKYSLLFITKNISKNLFLLIWNDSNVYSDETSKNISKNIREFFITDKYEKKYFFSFKNFIKLRTDYFYLNPDQLLNMSHENNEECLFSQSDLNFSGRREFFLPLQNYYEFAEWSYFNNFHNSLIDFMLFIIFVIL